jgi:hypothetical protein
MEVNQGADGLVDAGGGDIGKGAGDGGIGRGDADGLAIGLRDGGSDCGPGERGEERRTGKRRANCKPRAGKGSATSAATKEMHTLYRAHTRIISHLNADVARAP